MKLYQKILFAGLLVVILGWASNAMASPIPYTFTQYDAQATVIPFFPVGGTVSQEDIKASPPVSASAAANLSHANASAPDSSHFLAETFSKDLFVSSFLKATFKFSSTFPAIRIQYDFNLSADTGLDGANASGDVNSYLKDLTSGLTIWTDNPNVDAVTNFSNIDVGDFDSESGSIDKVLALALGHDYELFLSCATSGSVAQSIGTHGDGKAEITNIDVTAVPIPSALLLLSSGLAGLIGFRERFKS